MDFGFSAELALQYAVFTVLTALVSWVSVNFVSIVTGKQIGRAHV